MKLGVVAALSQELGSTLGAIPTTTRVVERLRFRECPSLIFVAAGVGSRPAAAAALLLADTWKPDALLSVGFCGALTEDLGTADLVLGGTTNHSAEPALLALARSCAAEARSGTVLTVPKVVVDAAEKKELAKKTGAVAVDMEADAVAIAAKARGLGFLSVKAVIDTPAAPLASTYAGCWTVLRELFKGSVMGMIHDSKRVKLASERFREFFLALRDKLAA
jgi:nucleoside phosphorylase